MINGVLDTLRHAGAGLRHRGRYRTIDAQRGAEATEIVRGGGLVNLAPLCGGIPPEIAWPYLRRAGEVVSNLTTTRGSNE
ncbi:hypothetical protein A5698_18815 [Mycobacterium sp. E136]|nr:hypothetical protein A5698_18815 [Mycobacterium sp. E136]